VKAVVLAGRLPSASQSLPDSQRWTANPLSSGLASPQARSSRLWLPLWRLTCKSCGAHTAVVAPAVLLAVETTGPLSANRR